MNNAETTLLSWLNNLVDNIVHWVQRNIAVLLRHCSTINTVTTCAISSCVFSSWIELARLHSISWLFFCFSNSRCDFAIFLSIAVLELTKVDIRSVVKEYWSCYIIRMCCNLVIKPCIFTMSKITEIAERLVYREDITRWREDMDLKTIF